MITEAYIEPEVVASLWLIENYFLVGRVFVDVYVFVQVLPVQRVVSRLRTRIA